MQEGSASVPPQRPEDLLDAGTTPEPGTVTGVRQKGELGKIPGADQNAPHSLRAIGDETGPLSTGSLMTLIHDVSHGVAEATTDLEEGTDPEDGETPIPDSITE
ncbi:hypothetical protein ACFL2V_19905 [Pseudomonadota bacterium]